MVQPFLLYSWNLASGNWSWWQELCWSMMSWTSVEDFCAWVFAHSFSVTTSTKHAVNWWLLREENSAVEVMFQVGANVWITEHWLSGLALHIAPHPPARQQPGRWSTAAPKLGRNSGGRNSAWRFFVLFFLREGREICKRTHFLVFEIIVSRFLDLKT